MRELITENQMNQMLVKLENATDKFIIAGLFYGLSLDEMCALKKSNVIGNQLMLEKRNILINDHLKGILEQAMAQEKYASLSKLKTSEVYSLNKNSEYVLSNRLGVENEMNPLSKNTMRTRIATLKQYLGINFNGNLLKQSGAFSTLAKEKFDWTVREANDYLKKNNYNIRMNTILEMVNFLKGTR